MGSWVSFIRRWIAKALEQTLAAAVGQAHASSPNVGVDVESVSNPCFLNEVFLERNFTKQERDQCGTSIRSYAGLWAGKEAVVKVVGNSGAKLKSAGAALQEIELKRGEDGAVSVELHGYASTQAASVGMTRFTVSLTYSDDHAVAAATGSNA